jgi:hypothetical protein
LKWGKKQKQRGRGEEGREENVCLCVVVCVWQQRRRESVKFLVRERRKGRVL